MNTILPNITKKNTVIPNTIKRNTAFHTKTYVWAVRVVEQPEYHSREWVRASVLMGRDLVQLWDAVLQSFAQDAIERQVGAQNVVLHPLVGTELAHLRPQAVQVLGEKKRRAV